MDTLAKPTGSIYGAAEKLANATSSVITPARYVNKKMQFMQSIMDERKKSIKPPIYGN